MFFVTKDADFNSVSGRTGHEDWFHEDLIDDLILRTHKFDKVQLVGSLESIVDQYIRPVLIEGIKDFTGMTLSDLGFDFPKAVVEAIGHAYDDNEWEPIDVGLLPECEAVELEKVEWANLLNIVDVRELPENRHLVKINRHLVKMEVEVIGWFDFELSRSSIHLDDKIWDPSVALLLDKKSRNPDMLPFGATISFRAIVDLIAHEFDPKEHQAQCVSVSPSEGRPTQLCCSSSS